MPHPRVMSRLEGFRRLDGDRQQVVQGERSMPVDVVFQGEAIGEVFDLQIRSLLPGRVDEVAAIQVDDPRVLQAAEDPGLPKNGGDVPVDPGHIEGLDDDPMFQVGILAEQRDPERPGARIRSTRYLVVGQTANRPSAAAAFCNSARASSQDFNSSAAR